MENMDNIEKKTEQPDTTPAENAAAETEAEVKPEAEVKAETKAETKAEADGQKAQTEEKPEENKESENDDDLASEASTKFPLTVKQVWNVIKGFCSKDAVNIIANQYEEKLPIWVILLPVYALLGAVSATVSFNATGTFNSYITSVLGTKTSFGSGEVFFSMFALNLTSALAISLGVRSFIKFHKGDGHFLSSANLVTASYLPVMFVFGFNIVTVGATSSVLDSVLNLAEIASIMLVFAGISKALNGKKPLWSFFLMIIIASVVAVIVAMIFTSHIWAPRFVFSIYEAFTKNVN